MKPLVLSLCLTGLLFSLQAQDRTLPGYIVKNTGDTVRGLLKEQGSDESAKQISFKASDADKDYQIYTPDQVNSFQYDGGNFFRAIRYPDPRGAGGGSAAGAGSATVAGSVTRTCFGKLLVTGEDDLYCFTESGGLYFLVRKDNSFILIYDDDVQAGSLGKSNFRSELNFLASGCAAMTREVQEIGYSISGMMAFFQRLDTCLNSQKPVQTYYRAPKGISGFYAYMGGISYGSRSQFTVEAGYRRIWPQVDPNFSLNLGLRFANLVKQVKDNFGNFHQATYQLFSLPVTMQYDLNLFSGNVKVFAFAGLSLSSANTIADTALDDNSKAKGFVLGAGMAVRVYHRLWVKTEWREEYMAQYPTVGAAIILP